MAGPAEPGAMQEWCQHWTVVVPCFLAIWLSSAQGYTLGVMIGPLEREFGWPRAQISLGLLFVSCMALIGGPIVGAAVDRWGARRIGLAGILLYCCAMATLSLANANLYSWWGLWLLVALVAVPIMPVIWLSAINGYFDKSRGLAMAMALSGTGMAAALWPIIANTLVEAFGWRMAYVSLGAIGAVVCFPAAWFLFREEGKARPSVRHDRTTAAPAPGPSAREQMKSARFFKLASASVIFSIGICMLTTNVVPVMIGEGLSPAAAAATAGALGIGSITGRIVGGFLLDRIDGNKVAAASVLLPIVPACILLTTDQSQLWAAVACLILGFSIGTELDCCGYLAARHFGSRNFGALFGTINGMLLFGAGVGPIVANYVYDVTRSYDLVLIGLLPVLVVTAILFLALGPYRHLDRETGLPVDAPPRSTG